MSFIVKILISALIISFASWLSGKKPQLAGFIVALPLTTILVLLFSQIEHQNSENTLYFAKSILAAIPISLLFFVPFLFAHQFKLGFWTTYMGGLFLLTAGYFAHKYLLKFFF